MAPFFCVLSLLLLGAPCAAGVEYSWDQLPEAPEELGAQVIQPLRLVPRAYRALAEDPFLLLENATIDLAWGACLDAMNAASALASANTTQGSSAAGSEPPGYDYYYGYAAGPAPDFGSSSLDDDAPPGWPEAEDADPDAEVRQELFEGEEEGGLPEEAQAASPEASASAVLPPGPGSSAPNDAAPAGVPEGEPASPAGQGEQGASPGGAQPRPEMTAADFALVGTKAWAASQWTPADVETYLAKLPQAPREVYSEKERGGRTAKEAQPDRRKMQGPHTESADDPEHPHLASEAKSMSRVYLVTLPHPRGRPAEGAEGPPAPGSAGLKAPGTFTRNGIKDAILQVVKATDAARQEPLVVTKLVVAQERHAAGDVSDCTSGIFFCSVFPGGVFLRSPPRGPSGCANGGPGVGCAPRPPGLRAVCSQRAEPAGSRSDPRPCRGAAPGCPQRQHVPHGMPE